MRTDFEKRAEQTRIAQDYQAGTDRERQKRDGVVVTPVQVIDFQIRAIIDELVLLHSTTLADPCVKLMDPFAGTGIYLARLMQVADLTPLQKIGLASRCRMVEIDPAACRIAHANLLAVMLEETGQNLTHPTIIHADTFTLGDEVWALGGCHTHD